MDITNKIIEKFGVELSNKDREVVKKFIYIVLILFIVSIFTMFIVFGYLTFDKYIKPTLQNSLE